MPVLSSLRKTYHSLRSKTCFSSTDTNNDGSYTRIVEIDTIIIDEKPHLYSAPTIMTETVPVPTHQTRLYRRAVLRPDFHSPDLPPPSSRSLPSRNRDPDAAAYSDDDPDRDNFSYDTVNMLSGVVSATAGTIGIGTGVMTLRQLRGQMREQAGTDLDLELGLNDSRPSRSREGGRPGVMGTQRAVVQSQASSVTAVNEVEPVPSRPDDTVWTGMK